MDIGNIEITEEMVQQALDEPREFGERNFGYHGSNDEMFESWSIGPCIQTRDSEILDRANAKSMLEAIQEAEDNGEIEKDSWEVISCGHWAVGWVEHLTFKAVDKNGEPTNVFKWIMAWQEMLQEYPCADDSLYSEMEYEATCECIKNNSPSVPDGVELPEDWVSQVFSDLWDNDIYPEEGWVSKDDVEKSFERLGFFNCQRCNGTGYVDDTYGKQIDFDGNEAYPKVVCQECEGIGVFSDD